MNDKSFLSCIIKLSEYDNAGVALSDLESGNTYDIISIDGKKEGKIRINPSQPPWMNEFADGNRTIPVYHKVATTDIPVGGKIVKYGTAIGTATSLIKKGQLIDQHISYSQDGSIHLSGNIKEFRNQFAIPQHYLDSAIQNYQVLVEGFESEVTLRPKETLKSGISIMAYRNRDGSIGSRRHILIIPSVFCVNQEAIDIARPFADTAWGISNENVVHPLTHSSGCCQAAFDEKRTLIVLSNMACHPNVGGVVVVALGCSPFCVDDKLFSKISEMRGGVNVHLVNVQREGRSQAIEKGIRAVEGMVRSLSADRRETSDLSDVILSVKCGASDPTSGLFANTAIGHISDLMLDSNASVIISEIMEFFGAETVLKEKCLNQDVWIRLLRKIKLAETLGKAVASVENQGFHSTELTAGNINAGLSTQQDKSLGAIRKMGFSHKIENAVNFGDSIVDGRQGLYVMDGPGQDLLSMSGMSASGAQAAFFSTGMGTPLGSPVTPVIKVTANRDVYEKHVSFIDAFIPVEKIIKDGISIKEIARDILYPLLIEVLEGKKTLAEINGHRDFAIKSNYFVQ